MIYNTRDENGHGTHVSAIIGGVNYGVAKRVNIVGIKAFDDAGEGETHYVTSSLDWIINQPATGCSLVNISFSTHKPFFFRVF